MKDIEETPEEKVKMAKLRAEIMADIEKESTFIETATPEEIAASKANIERLLVEFKKAAEHTDELIDKFNADFPDNPINRS